MVVVGLVWSKNHKMYFLRSLVYLLSLREEKNESYIEVTC